MADDGWTGQLRAGLIWSEHVGAETGDALCQVEHVGIVLSGEAVAAMEDGTQHRLRPGQSLFIPPGHDSWVDGDEPYVSLHLLGSQEYGT